MRFRPGGPLVNVRYHFVKEGTHLFPLDSAFFSAGWFNSNWTAGSLGEQSNRGAWFRGSPLTGGCGKYGCLDHPEWWTTGIPDGQFGPPVGPDGFPICCCAPPASCTWDALPDTVTFTCVPVGCFPFDGASGTLTKTGGNSYVGTIAGLFGSTLAVTLTNTLGTPEGFSGEFTATVSGPGTTVDQTVDPGGTCDPVDLTWTGVDFGGGLPCPPLTFSLSP